LNRRASTAAASYRLVRIAVVVGPGRRLVVGVVTAIAIARHVSSLNLSA
jgi:hypothetical protein